MDLGPLIRDAWRMTWRHPFLWLLGLFAGGAGSACGGGGGGGGGQTGWELDEGELPAGVGNAVTGVGMWLLDNIGLVLGLVALAVLLGLVLFVVSLVAQGGLSRATADLARGRPTGGRLAWAVGLALFWRYLGLWALIVLIGLLVLLAVGLVVGLVVLAASASDAGVVVGIALAVLLGLPLLLALIVAAIAFNIVVLFALRGIAIEDVGPLAGLRLGWRLLRARPGESALIWLVQVVLGLAVGVGIVLVAGIVLAVLGAVGALFWAVAGFSAPTFAYAGLGIAAFLALVLALSAVSNTYFWSYWTLAYLQLRQAVAAPTPPPAPPPSAAA